MLRLVLRVTHNFIPAVQRPQMPANKNRHVYSIETMQQKNQEMRKCVNSAFDARGDRLSVYYRSYRSCARKTQLEVRADPAKDLLQRRVFYKPIASLLIGGAETVNDSGVGDCSEILIFGYQYGTVRFKEKVRGKGGKSNSGTVRDYHECPSNFEEQQREQSEVCLTFLRVLSAC